LLLGALCISCFHPRRSGIPPIAITPDKVEKYSLKKEGVKGMLPTCCFPLWGREGGHPPSCRREYANYRKKRISHENHDNQI
jgi:hypothetical protein